MPFIIKQEQGIGQTPTSQTSLAESPTLPSSAAPLTMIPPSPSTPTPTDSVNAVPETEVGPVLTIADKIPLADDEDYETARMVFSLEHLVDDFSPDEIRVICKRLVQYGTDHDLSVHSFWLDLVSDPSYYDSTERKQMAKEYGLLPDDYEIPQTEEPESKSTKDADKPMPLEDADLFPVKGFTNPATTEYLTAKEMKRETGVKVSTPPLDDSRENSDNTGAVARIVNVKADDSVTEATLKGFVISKNNAKIPTALILRDKSPKERSQLKLILGGYVSCGFGSPGIPDWRLRNYKNDVIASFAAVGAQHTIFVYRVIVGQPNYGEQSDKTEIKPGIVSPAMAKTLCRLAQEILATISEDFQVLISNAVGEEK